MLVKYEAEIFCTDTYSDTELRTGILLKYQAEVFLLTRIATVQNHGGLLAITAGRNPFLLTPIVTLQKSNDGVEDRHATKLPGRHLLH